VTLTFEGITGPAMRAIFSSRSFTRSTAFVPGFLATASVHGRASVFAGRLVEDDPDRIDT